MLISANTLAGYGLHATDGEIGQLHDFLFDDREWVVRYMVVKTGGWLSSRKVLIAPEAVERPAADEKLLPVRLTREQIRNAPEIDAAKPVSQQQAVEINQYYGWRAPHWFAGGGPQFTPPPMPPGTPEVLQEEGGDPHLRSTREVAGYHLEAADGSLGHVEDFLADVGEWALRYLIIDTRNWLPGKKILLIPRAIEEILWSERRVRVDLTRERIRQGPEYVPGEAPEREYEGRLHDYFGWPKYWI